MLANKISFLVVEKDGFRVGLSGSARQATGAVRNTKCVRKTKAALPPYGGLKGHSWRKGFHKERERELETRE